MKTIAEILMEIFSDPGYYEEQYGTVDDIGYWALIVVPGYIKQAIAVADCGYDLHDYANEIMPTPGWYIICTNSQGNTTWQEFSDEDEAVSTWNTLVEEWEKSFHGKGDDE